MYHVINPFYNARIGRKEPPASKAEPPRQVRWARLPAAPINGSPVPGLTSLYHWDEAGPWGSRAWPGNCGGNIIRDLLLYFQPKGIVADVMSGSGTCKQVCDDLKLPCWSQDIHQGFDACDPQGFGGEDRFAFIWAHPPYWRMKEYSTDPRDLSRAKTLDDFLLRYRRFFQNCRKSLAPGGRLAVLMGDYSDRDAGYVPLVYHTKRLAFAAGFKQACTDIIRFSHGNSSSKKVYRSSFIPGLHDVCTIFEKAG